MPGPLEIGNVLSGRYRVDKHLSSGGTADIYKAWDGLLKKRVVVKVPSPDRFPEHAGFNAASLEREMLAFSFLQLEKPHPRIVQMIDCGFDHETSYLVLEYLEGDTLDSSRSALGIERSVKATVDVLEGLQAVHDAGLVYRDMKPANVILTREGSKIIDFGLAKLPLGIGPAEPVGSGFTCGTALFAAPEQGRTLDIDLRVDLYACGHILYWLLTGRDPISSDLPKGVHLKGPFWIEQAFMLYKNYFPALPFSETAPDFQCPPALEAAIMKALERNPDRRHTSASEMRQALLDALR